MCPGRLAAPQCPVCCRLRRRRVAVFAVVVVVVLPSSSSSRCRLRCCRRVDVFSPCVRTGGRPAAGERRDALQVAIVVHRYQLPRSALVDRANADHLRLLAEPRHDLQGECRRLLPAGFGTRAVPPRQQGPGTPRCDPPRQQVNRQNGETKIATEALLSSTGVTSEASDVTGVARNL